MRCSFSSRIQSNLGRKMEGIQPVAKIVELQDSKSLLKMNGRHL
jgi:hypothetical protein